MSQDYYKIKNGYHEDKDRYVIETETSIDNKKQNTIAYFTEGSYRQFLQDSLSLIETTKAKKNKNKTGE